MYSPLRSHTRFCDQPQTGCSASTRCELDRPASLVSQAWFLSQFGPAEPPSMASPWKREAKS